MGKRKSGSTPSGGPTAANSGHSGNGNGGSGGAETQAVAASSLPAAASSPLSSAAAAAAGSTTPSPGVDSAIAAGVGAGVVAGEGSEIVHGASQHSQDAAASSTTGGGAATATATGGNGATATGVVEEVVGMSPGEGNVLSSSSLDPKVIGEIAEGATTTASVAEGVSGSLKKEGEGNSSHLKSEEEVRLSRGNSAELVEGFVMVGEVAATESSSAPVELEKKKSVKFSDGSVPLKRTSDDEPVSESALKSRLPPAPVTVAESSPVVSLNSPTTMTRRVSFNIGDESNSAKSAQEAFPPSTAPKVSPEKADLNKLHESLSEFDSFVQSTSSTLSPTNISEETPLVQKKTTSSQNQIDQGFSKGSKSILEARDREYQDVLMEQAASSQMSSLTHSGNDPTIYVVPTNSTAPLAQVATPDFKENDGSSSVPPTFGSTMKEAIAESSSMSGAASSDQAMDAFMPPSLASQSSSKGLYQPIRGDEDDVGGPLEPREFQGYEMSQDISITDLSSGPLPLHTSVIVAHDGGSPTGGAKRKKSVLKTPISKLRDRRSSASTMASGPPSPKSSANNDSLSAICFALLPYPLQRLGRFVGKLLQSSYNYFMKHVMFESIWTFLTLLGIVNGVSAWCIDRVVEHLLAFRFTLYSIFIDNNEVIKAVIAWELYTILLTILSVVSTRFFSLAATGSGIPEMKCIINGFSIPGYLSVQTLVSKIVGVTLAMGAGLFCGKDGPFVHISGIYAVQMLRLKPFRQISESRALTKQVLAAACAAGMSSTIGVPLGGVLFSMEVTNTLYQTTHQAKEFYCAVIGMIAFQIFTRLGGSEYTSLFTTDFPENPYSVAELPLFIAISLLCGMAGGGYVYLFRKLINVRNYYMKRFPGTVTPISFAAFVGAVVGISYYPYGFFLEYSIRRSINELITDNSLVDNPEGERWENPSILFNLILYTFVKTCIGLLTLALPIPRGLFIPAFAIGAGAGRFFGEVIHIFGGSTIYAGGYALVGGAAFTAGVTGTIATAVIFFELTKQLSYMLPLLLAVTLGKAAAQLVSKDIYVVLGMTQRLPYLPEFDFQLSYDMSVREVMQKNDIIVPRFLTLRQIEEILEGKKPTLSSSSSPALSPAKSKPRLKRFESAARPAIDRNNNADDYVSAGLVVSAADSKQPSYMLPVVDAAELFVGAVSRHQLYLVFDTLTSLARSRMSETSESADGSTFVEEDTVVDIVRVCNTDSLAVNLPADTLLQDAMLLYEVHRSNCFFITDRHHVIGRLDLAHVCRMCDEKKL